MRETIHGLHKGSRIHVRGAGKLGNGTVSREPDSAVAYLYYRDDWNGGERLAQVSRVRRIDGPRVP